MIIIYLFVFTGSCSSGKITTITWQYLLSGIWAPDSCHRFTFCWFICGKPLLISPLTCQCTFVVDMCSEFTFCLYPLPDCYLILRFTIVAQTLGMNLYTEWYYVGKYGDQNPPVVSTTAIGLFTHLVIWNM